MGNYAKGKYAYGICDRTGFRYKLSDLKPGVIPYTGWMHGQKLVKSGPKYYKVSKILPTTLYHQHYKFNTNKIT